MPSGRQDLNLRPLDPQNLRFGVSAHQKRARTMNDVTFRYYAVPDYRRLIGAHGLELVDVHDDPGVSTYYLARKLPSR